MKILFTNTAPIITRGMGPAFVDLGHEVRYVNVEHDGGAPFFRALDEFQPDYVFTDAGWGDFRGILFPLLHERKIPHIFWAIEDPVFFNHLSLPWSRESAYVFTTCIESIEDYNKHGMQAHLIPFACHPSFNKTVAPDSRFSHDITFIGNNYTEHPERIKAANYVIKPLLDKDYNIKIYGLPWWTDKSRPFYIDPRFYGGYLPSEDLSTICASVPIILGLHSVVNSLTMMSMRTFEILGCGGFYLTQWTPAIEYYFKNHHHLVWTRSAEETIELVDFYLSKPDLRAKIARQGQEEVYAKHTYLHRAQDILKAIGMPAEINVNKNINPMENQLQSQPILSRKGITIKIGSTSIVVDRKKNTYLVNKKTFEPRTKSQIVKPNIARKQIVYDSNKLRVKKGVKLKY
ncbi:Spore protein YkvP [Candidatus Syntrophocurvum alkaliphilum]|uniref:Spore protein YkvP n=1 Tax=Candidatus Syntrophocurvum alkaliphilum TaxID=2293317 RepID=A0A6I6DNR1_9FIRM|nr:glycosyltransferase [Candidatus Syntrophocurvum alkaliphilum]QGU00568.1 Spore protein YkvP [Candidatus Syntrophocurvum alkaliphilum]